MIFFLKKKSKSFFLIFSCELILKSFAYANYLINICVYICLEKKFLVKIAVDKFALKDLMKNDAKCPSSLEYGTGQCNFSGQRDRCSIIVPGQRDNGTS